MQARQWIFLFCIGVLVGAVAYMSTRTTPTDQSPVSLSTQSASPSQPDTTSQQTRAQEATWLASDPKLTLGDSKTYTSCADNTQITEAECDALVALYANTQGEARKTKDHWLANMSPCSWYGVTCVGGHIVSIDLSDNGLNGSLPDQIGDLNALTDLNLADNQINGALPDSIGGCAALVNLVLSRNAISGQLPTSLYSIKSLQNIALARNKLTGKLSPAISALQQLRTLSLANNQLSWPLPKTLWDIPTLSWLVINDNQFCDQLPDSIAKLTITDGKLDLSHNHFITDGYSTETQSWIDTNIDRGTQESASCE